LKQKGEPLARLFVWKDRSLEKGHSHKDDDADTENRAPFEQLNKEPVGLFMFRIIHRRMASGAVIVSHVPLFFKFTPLNGQKITDGFELA
jgi:hypothetical protein